MMESLRAALHSATGPGSLPGVSPSAADHGASAATAAAAAAPTFDSRSHKITVAGFEVEGVSISGQETCIILPRLKVVLDTGRCPQRAIFQQTVLLTHGHLDHIGGIPFHITSRGMQGLPPSKLVVPPVCADGIVRMLNVIDELQGGREPMKYELLPLAPGQEMQLPSGFVVRPFATTHTVTSQGYVIYSQRKRLCADLQGSSQEEIRDARLAGREVTEVFEVPEVAFTGDTTSAFFDGPHPAAAAAADDDPAPAFAAAAAADADSDSGSLPVSTSAHGAPPSAPSGASPPAAAVPPARALSLLDDVLRAKLLIIELTFLDDSVIVEQAREKGHMHIADFVANAHRFQNEAILLVHFSARYSRKQILEALNTWLPPALRARCVPFLNGIA